MMAVVAKGLAGQPLTLGVAFVNSTFHTMGVCEIEDTADLKALEALTVQVGAAFVVSGRDRRPWWSRRFALHGGS
jgi:hypothetical protein